MSQQAVFASTFGLGLEERNFKNSRLEEGGTFLGIQYQAKIDNHFYLGIRSRVYYVISVIRNPKPVTQKSHVLT
jgi:hypothetical protein